MKAGKTILSVILMMGCPYAAAAGSGERDAREYALKPKECPPGSRLVQSDHPDEGFTQVCMDSKGRQHGWRLVWYPNGQAKEYSEAVHGTLQGRGMGWYQNGKLKYALEHNRGDRQGLQTSWFENGQKRSEGRFLNGFREGPWMFWFPNGQVRKWGRYKKGVLAGRWKYWTEKGVSSESEVFIKWPEKPKQPSAVSKPAPSSQPSKRLDVGVLLGSSLVKKRLVLEDSRLGRIKQIAESRSAGGFWFVGERGALLADHRFHPGRWVKFSRRATEASVLDVDGDGLEEFLVRTWFFGHHQVSMRTFLLDSKGAVRRGSRALWGIQPVATGDLDGDGRMEFAGPGFWRKDDASEFEWGIAVQDANGKTVRSLPVGGLSRVFLLDGDGDGRLEIASLDRRDHLLVHDSKGTVLKEGKVKKGVRGATLCPWPTRGGLQRFLFVDETSVWLAGFPETTPVRFDAPLANTGSITAAVGVPVRFRSTHRPYLAVAVRLRLPQSLLYILTPKGRVEFLEVLPGPVEALGIATTSGRDEEALLVGGDGRVWSYKFNQVEYDNLAEAVFRVFAFGSDNIKLADVQPKNVANQVRDGWFELTIYIDGSGDSLEKIHCVQYSLHPSFPDPHQLVCEPGDGPHYFALQREGWGTFDVGIRIFLKSGPVQEMSHSLRF